MPVSPDKVQNTVTRTQSGSSAEVWRIQTVPSEGRADVITSVDLLFFSSNIYVHALK